MWAHSKTPWFCYSVPWWEPQDGTSSGCCCCTGLWHLLGQWFYEQSRAGKCTADTKNSFHPGVSRLHGGDLNVALLAAVIWESDAVFLSLCCTPPTSIWATYINHLEARLKRHVCFDCEDIVCPKHKEHILCAKRYKEFIVTSWKKTKNKCTLYFYIIDNVKALLVISFGIVWSCGRRGDFEYLSHFGVPPSVTLLHLSQDLHFQQTFDLVGLLEGVSVSTLLALQLCVLSLMGQVLCWRLVSEF